MSVQHSQFVQIGAQSTKTNLHNNLESPKNDDEQACVGARHTGVLSKHSKAFSPSYRAVDAEEEARKRQGRLVLAARSGDFRRTVDAVAEGADVHATNLKGQTPMMLAASSYYRDNATEGDQAPTAGGALDTLSFIIDARAAIEAKDEKGWTAILHACRNNEQKSVELLLAKGASIKAKAADGKTALMLSVMERADALVLYLIKRKAQIEKRDENGWSLLFYACQEARRELVKTLLEKRANAKDKAKDGTTPLMVTACNGNLRIGQALLKNGATVNSKSAQGMTALMFALQNGKEAFGTWLLDEDADVSTRNQDGFLAMDIAEKMGMNLMKNQLDLKGRTQQEKGRSHAED